VIVTAIFALKGLPRLWVAVTALSSRHQAERLYVARGRSALALMPALEDSAHLLTTRLGALAPRLLDATAESEATAELAGLLGHLALQQRARVDRSDGVPDSAVAGDLRRVSLDAVLETDVRGLADLLGAFSTGDPVTEVTRLRISAQDPSAGGTGPEVLRIEVRLRGWYLPQEPS